MLYTEKEVENLLESQLIKTANQCHNNIELSLVKIPPKNLKQKIEYWKELTNHITENWIREYFEIDDNEDVSVDWVADDVGGVFEFGDMYFNFSDVLDCYKYNITKEQLFLWYSYCLDNQFVNISLAKFILSPQERREKEEKELERCRENVEFAKKELEKAINNYEK